MFDKFVIFSQASVKPFQGSGYVLGSVVPPVVGQSSSSAASASPPVSVDKHKELVSSLIIFVSNVVIKCLFRPSSI